MIMEDAETGEQLYVDTHDTGVPASASRRQPRQREAELDAGVPAGRGRALSLSTDEDLVRAIVRMADAPATASER